MEPPAKRLRTNTFNEIIDQCIDDIKNTKNLTPIISETITESIPLICVAVGIIKDVTDISTVIKVLNDKLPLKELSHLKRVRHKGIILCPVDFIVGSIQDYLNMYFSEICHMFSYFQQVQVPKYGPKTKKQLQEVKKHWSCNFHPNPEYERLVSDNFFNQKDLKLHKYYMELAFKIFEWFVQEYNPPKVNFSDINVTVVVDPTPNSIVAVGFANTKEHPIQHSAMIAIDNVSTTQGGGAWSQNPGDSKLSGIPTDLLKYLRTTYPVQNFGLIMMKDDSTVPYLCTGYMFYMLKEPCFMCAMGMVHARVKQVFFALNNNEKGALRSQAKLHTTTSLNHRYEVFTGFVQNSELFNLMTT